MRATGLILTSFDEPAALRPFEVAEPADDQLLIEIKASSINAFDWKVAEGSLKHAFTYEFPVVIGRDYAGIVRKIGQGVTKYQVGDAIFGYLGGPKLHRGTFATHLIVNENDASPSNPRASTSRRRPACR
ncbi:alcohol dehydrogenase catalytic domain-containing protein [Actinoplanes sp. CA-142083]|uniref:alcohol dehydrogenase catalytic domain-containing protein n=1 Tax=Actinoplanes sp. CA-142083 TaxID=3239903 RepID=UPI003D94249A